MSVPDSTSPPLVSVVLPVYNAAVYLESAIQSVLDQTFTDFELIAVDDGSKDRSLSILKDLQKRDARLRILSRPNTGIVGALNDGIAMARGKYIARMDSDDLSLPKRFEKQVQYLEAHPDCVLVGSLVMQIDPDGRPIAPMQQTHLTHSEIDDTLLKGEWPLVHPAVMMRKDAVHKVGLYVQGTFPVEDHHLFLRLAEVGTLANIPEVLLHYRRHPASICVNNGAEQGQLMAKTVNDAIERRKLTHRPPLVAQKREVPTVAQLHKIWAWAALRARNVATARHHARKFLMLSPFCKEAWSLVFCSLRGR